MSVVSFSKVHSLFDPVLNAGLMDLMDYFNSHNVAIEMERPPVKGTDDVYSVTFRLKDAVAKAGFTDNAKDVQFRMKLHSAEGQEPHARGIVRVSRDEKHVRNLNDAEDCKTFAEALIRTMQRRNMAWIPLLYGL